MRFQAGQGRKNRIIKVIASMVIGSPASALAAPAPVQLEDCVTIQADAERLACYDQVARYGRGAASAASNDANVSPSPEKPEHDNNADSYLASHWELDTAHKRGIFNFRPHSDNYLIATYNPSPNNAPYRPFQALNPESSGLAHTELVYQLGFKMKLAEKPFDQPLDFWFGYTQRSFWQAGNHQASSPFRETDYQPELMAVVPANLALPGLKMRLINFGLLHQSNGQGSTLSRSWNRAYAQFGFEQGGFTLLARAWKRFNESADSDDNPDIVDYMGHGDLIGTYRRNGQEFSLLLRHNFHTDKGAARASWAYPLASNLKAYLQFFSGYGYSLIDYNVYQRVIGLGFLVTFR